MTLTRSIAPHTTTEQPASILDAGDIDYLVHHFTLPALREQAHICETERAVSRCFGEDDRADFYADFGSAFRLAADVRRWLDTPPRQPAPAGQPRCLNIADLKARVDIVEVAGRYTNLRKSGRNFVGLCPLHDDRAPSFYVYADDQSWHCYGACGRGGDVLDLVMAAEHLELRAAAERLT